jgi:hypothetical protein
MSERILFQIDRRSGVRGTLIATPAGLRLDAVNEYNGVLKLRSQTVSQGWAARFVAVIREKNGDGDVEIVMDEWDSFTQEN